MFTKCHTLLGITSILLLSACSTNSPSISSVEIYDEPLELVSIVHPDVTFTTQNEFFTDDPRENGTFFAEDWVKPKDVITYKYLGDEHIYREDELPKNKGRLGNVIIKLPDNMDKDEFLSKLNDRSISY